MVEATDVLSQRRYAKLSRFCDIELSLSGCPNASLARNQSRISGLFITSRPCSRSIASNSGRFCDIEPSLRGYASRALNYPASENTNMVGDLSTILVLEGHRSNKDCSFRNPRLPEGKIHCELRVVAGDADSQRYMQPS